MNEQLSEKLQEEQLSEKLYQEYVLACNCHAQSWNESLLKHLKRLQPDGLSDKELNLVYDHLENSYEHFHEIDWSNDNDRLEAYYNFETAFNSWIDEIEDYDSGIICTELYFWTDEIYRDLDEWFKDIYE